MTYTARSNAIWGKPPPVPVHVVRRNINPPVFQFARQSGLSDLSSRILAGRVPEVDQAERLLSAALSNLDDPSLLPDVDRAADRVLAAMRNSEVVSLSCDHDADGTGAAAIMYRALTALGHPPGWIQFHISHRLREGYGLNQSLAKRILATDPRPKLVITADNGSGDEPRIEMLKSAAIDVIVTDHHMLPEDGPPRSALAVVNPTRPDSLYPDKTVCGAMVAWLLMSHVRRRGIELGLFRSDAPKFTDLLAIAAISTVADCVSMASGNNRAVVRAGLRLINMSEEPFCAVLREQLGNGKQLNEEDIGFQIAPRLAAHGRLDESMPGIRFLLATSVSEATQMFGTLSEANNQRKEIQKALTEQAMIGAAAMVARGTVGLAVFLKDGMAGVHGITSSRITDHYGLPSAMLSPMLGDGNLIAVSCRGIRDFDTKRALQEVADAAPGLLLSHGGHPGAGGAKLALDDVPRFQQLFDRAVRAQLGNRRPQRSILVDGDLPGGHLMLGLVDEMGAMAPFGRGFEAPIWEGAYDAVGVRRIGRDGTHMSFSLTSGRQSHKAVWFRAMERDGDPLPIRDGNRIQAIFRLGDSVWRGKRRLEVFVERAHAIAKCAPTHGFVPTGG